MDRRVSVAGVSLGIVGISTESNEIGALSTKGKRSSGITNEMEAREQVREEMGREREKGREGREKGRRKKKREGEKGGEKRDGGKGKGAAADYSGVAPSCVWCVGLVCIVPYRIIRS